MFEKINTTFPPTESQGNDLANSDPDLVNPLIPEKWRQWCGYRYIPKNISFPKKCFMNPIEDKWVPHPFESMGNKVSDTSLRVLGGKDSRNHEAPWTVQITKKVPDSYGIHRDHHGCTGVFLTMRHILTAAHCFNDGLPVRVYAGSDLTAKGWNSDHLTPHKHPNYTGLLRYPNGTKYKNRHDIAIMILTKPVDWNRWGKHRGRPDLLINTICLPKIENFVDKKFTGNPYRNATLYGWGKTWAYDDPNRLQRGDVSLRYIKGLEMFEFKAEANEPRGCSGDSGGGLVQYMDKYETRAVLIALHILHSKKTNMTRPPCNFDQVGISKALRVANYLDWIYSKLSL